MDTTHGAPSGRDLDIEEWMDQVRSICGRYNPEGGAELGKAVLPEHRKSFSGTATLLKFLGGTSP